MTIPQSVQSLNYHFNNTYFDELVIGDNITFNENTLYFDSCSINNLKLTSSTKMEAYESNFKEMTPSYGQQQIYKISVPAALVSEYKEDSV